MSVQLAGLFPVFIQRAERCLLLGNLRLDFAHAATEYVSKYIRMLAVGVMVLGVAFAVLDRCQLLPRLPEVAAVATTAAVSAVSLSFRSRSRKTAAARLRGKPAACANRA